MARWEKQGFDLAEFKREPEYERVSPLPGSPKVDVVIPFCEGDADYLAEAVTSLILQQHVSPTLHIVSDGTFDFPVLPPMGGVKQRWYQTDGEAGPYRITNALVRDGRIRTQWLAIHDADDIALDFRLWRQLALLDRHKADHISSAMENFIQPGQEEFLSKQLLNEPVLYPGVKFKANPKGRFVNSTRMMRVSSFIELNGFWGASMCGGDFEFDNRVRFTGQSAVDDNCIVSQRRLHKTSLTHGRFPFGGVERERNTETLMSVVNRMRREPLIAVARELGDLDKVAVKLRRIR